MCESPLHGVRVLPWLQSRISELALFADDMLLSRRKFTCFFLYEFSLVCLFVCFNVSLPISNGSWQYILWFSTTVSQPHKKGHLKVMKGSIIEAALVLPLKFILLLSDLR